MIWHMTGRLFNSLPQSLQKRIRILSTDAGAGFHTVEMTDETAGRLRLLLSARQIETAWALKFGKPDPHGGDTKHAEKEDTPAAGR